MTLPKTILVPTDFGEPSEAALDYAIDFAKAVGAQIVLLHTYDVPTIGFPDGVISATGDLTPQILEGAKVGLDRQLARRAASGVTVRTLIKEGDAVAIINAVAVEVGADLIVMGTHGRTGLPRALIGSVAEKVVRTAHVPVLTMHAGEQALAPHLPPAVANGVRPEPIRQR